MDVLGCIIIASITAVGGGTVRDLLLGNVPVFWMKDVVYLKICLFTAAITFGIWPLLEKLGGAWLHCCPRTSRVPTYDRLAVDELINAVSPRCEGLSLALMSQ